MKKFISFFFIAAMLFLILPFVAFGAPSVEIVYENDSTQNNSSENIIVDANIRSLTATGVSSSELFEFTLSPIIDPLIIGTLSGSNSTIIVEGNLSVTNNISSTDIFNIKVASGSSFEAKNISVNGYINLAKGTDTSHTTFMAEDIIFLGEVNNVKTLSSQKYPAPFGTISMASYVDITIKDFIYNGFRDCFPAFEINNSSNINLTARDITIENNVSYEDASSDIWGGGVWLFGLLEGSTVRDITVRGNDTTHTTGVILNDSKVTVNSISFVDNNMVRESILDFALGVYINGASIVKVEESLVITGNTGNSRTPGLTVISSTLYADTVEVHGNDLILYIRSGKVDYPFETTGVINVNKGGIINIGSGTFPTNVDSVNINPDGTLKASGFFMLGTSYTGYLNNSGTLHSVDEGISVQGFYRQSETGVLRLALSGETLSSLYVTRDAVINGSIEIHTEDQQVDSDIVDQVLPFLSLGTTYNGYVTGLTDGAVISHNLGKRYLLTLVLDNPTSTKAAGILVTLINTSNPNDFDLDLPYNAEQTLMQISDMYPIDNDILPGTPLNDIVLEMISSYDEATEAGDTEVIRLLNALSGVIHTATFNMSFSGIEDIAMASKQTKITILPVVQAKIAATDQNASTFNAFFHGGITDANLNIGAFNFGITALAGSTSLTQKLNGSYGKDIDTANGYDIQAGISAGVTVYKVSFDIYAGYGLTHADVERNIKTAENYTLYSTYNTNRILASAKLSYGNENEPGLTVMLGLTYDLRWRNDVFETGEEMLVLQILDRAYNKFILSVGGSYKVKTDVFDVLFTALYKHNFSYKYYDIDVKFINADGLFNIRGIDMGRSVIAGSMTFEKVFENNIKTFADFDLELGIRTITFTTKLGLTYKF